MSDEKLELKLLTTEELILQLKDAPIQLASLYCEELITRFEPLLRRAWQREVAGEYQDFVQDVFVRLFAGLPQLRNPKAFPGYLRSIVLSVASHHWRSKGRALSRTAAEVERLVHGFDETLITRIFIRTYVERLPSRERDVIAMAYLQDLSTAEIAIKLEMKTGAVRSLKGRALNRLRELFLEDAKDLSGTTEKK